MPWKQLNINRFLSASYVLSGRPRVVRIEPSIVLLNINANKFITEVIYNKNMFGTTERMWQVTTKALDTNSNNLFKNMLDNTTLREYHMDYCVPVLDISYLDWPFRHLNMEYDNSKEVKFRREEHIDDIKAELDLIKKHFSYKCIEPPEGYMIGENHFLFFKHERWLDN